MDAGRRLRSAAGMRAARAESFQAVTIGTLEPYVSRDGFGRFYREAGLTSRITFWGSAERCGEAVGRIIAHCARLLIFNPVFDEAEQLDRVGVGAGANARVRLAAGTPCRTRHARAIHPDHKSSFGSLLFMTRRTILRARILSQSLIPTKTRYPDATRMRRKTKTSPAPTMSLIMHHFPCSSRINGTLPLPI